MNRVEGAQRAWERKQWEEGSFSSEDDTGSLFCTFQWAPDSGGHRHTSAMHAQSVAPQDSYERSLARSVNLLKTL